MTVREIEKAIADLPPAKLSLFRSWFENFYVRAKFQQGESEIKQKKGISHEEAKKRLRKWVK